MSIVPALMWFNDNTPGRCKLLRGGAPTDAYRRLAARTWILVVIAPNAFVKQQKQEDRKIDSGIVDLRKRFWHEFDGALQADDASAGVGGATAAGSVSVDSAGRRQ